MSSPNTEGKPSLSKTQEMRVCEGTGRLLRGNRQCQRGADGPGKS